MSAHDEHVGRTRIVRFLSRWREHGAGLKSGYVKRLDAEVTRQFNQWLVANPGAVVLSVQVAEPHGMVDLVNTWVELVAVVRCHDADGEAKA